MSEEKTTTTDIAVYEEMIAALLLNEIEWDFGDTLVLKDEDEPACGAVGCAVGAWWWHRATPEQRKAADNYSPWTELRDALTMGEREWSLSVLGSLQYASIRNNFGVHRVSEVTCNMVIERIRQHIEELRKLEVA